MDIKDAITLVLATVGAVLGVFNAWRNWIKDRVRVRLEVSNLMTLDGDGGLVLDIRNLSDFPVTITGIGFNLPNRMVIQLARPRFTREETLPVRLESRAACTVLARPPEYPASVLDIQSAYAKTACGLTVKGGWRFFNDQRTAAATQHTPGSQ
jgi:hypothetical protein